MLASELRKETLKKLEDKRRQTKKDLEKIKIDALQDKEGNVQKIRSLKKDYARILTVINEKRRKQND